MDKQMKKILLLILAALGAVSIAFSQPNGNFQSVRLTMPSAGDSANVSTNNGTIFYNKSSNIFRFRQNGAWVSFVPTGQNYWSLANGGTLTGANTITSDAPNQLFFSGSWTATNNGNYFGYFSGSATARTTANDALYGWRTGGTLTGGASNTQYLYGATVETSLVGGADNTDYATALGIFPTYTGTLSNRIGIYAEGATTSTFNGLRILNNSTGASSIVIQAANGGNVATGANQISITRSTGANGNAQFYNYGTGGTTFGSSQVLFTPDATYSGLKIGTLAGVPSTTAVGDFWYNTTAGCYGGVNGSGTVYFLVGSPPATNQIPFMANNSGTVTSSTNFTNNGTMFVHSMGDRNNAFITPTQLTADVNDWSPTSLSTTFVIRASSDATRNITGMLAGTAGDIKVLFNVGSFDILLLNESTSSSAANRFALPQDGTTTITLVPGSSIYLWYDGTSSRWRALGNTN